MYENRTASFLVRQILAVVLKVAQFRLVHALAIGARELGVMVALSDVVHHAANAEVVFVGTVSAVVDAVATLVHGNAAFVVASESIVQRAADVG